VNRCAGLEQDQPSSIWVNWQAYVTTYVVYRMTVKGLSVEEDTLKNPWPRLVTSGVG